jgi:hypothetical protein
MGRTARIVLVVVSLALVFAPRALTTAASHEGPRQLTAAVLAPSTGDSDALTPARDRDVVPNLALVAVLVAGLAVVAVALRREPVAVEPPAQDRGPTRPRPPRRGPPRPLA